MLSTIEGCYFSVIYRKFITYVRGVINAVSPHNHREAVPLLLIPMFDLFRSSLSIRMKNKRVILEAALLSVDLSLQLLHVLAGRLFVIEHFDQLVLFSD